MSNAGPLVPNWAYRRVVGRTLATLRKGAGYSQVEMAEYVEVSQATWSRVERGMMDISVLHIGRACSLVAKKRSAVLDLIDDGVSRTYQAVRLQNIGFDDLGKEPIYGLIDFAVAVAVMEAA